MAIVIPQASVPLKSSDLHSAYKYLNDDVLCAKLDQVRARAKLVGQAEVDNIDWAICFLVLDCGYDAEMTQELMGTAMSELAQEAAAMKKK